MTLLSELKLLLDDLEIPNETAVFTKKAPESYVVMVPMSDAFDNYADDQPLADIQDVRLSLFTKTNYNAFKNKIIKKLLEGGYTITARNYIDYEVDTGYYHYNIDVEKVYETEETYGNDRTG